MQFNLKKDLCFFDLESTGLNVIRDRILQIGIIKYFKDGREPAELEMLINPGMPIGAEAMSVHGITPKDVANKPVFEQVAQQIFDFIGDADLAGYNISRFDVPMLMEEFARAGLDFDVDKRRLVDVQRIFYKMEPRNLKAALRFYCGKEMEDAHDAMADVRATVDVFVGQLGRYEGVDHLDDDGNITPTPIVNDMQALHDFTQDTNNIDVTNRLKYNEHGEIVFNFGKYTGVPVLKVFDMEPNYGQWILSKDFGVQVKSIIRKMMKEHEQRKRGSSSGQ
ncbi:MAG: 3'-5' exonuclease [Saprospiraceae bacterium]|nr:3'-5' exonuclease [Saprospiraceae bacterium]MCF8252709.1 3'-5' exonuclease [Saprospiraceae bacterium]MCF8282933.1 3'-5' exonuclease [Bacteroidales bacterium]MCF8311643.1 3'-5' exonuclease [Saprospiraceae bacterium]MCF8440984.1 3'-5' exonuclease [Saprospiraceae bacterium]